jgi:hypothetical protein
MFLSNLLPQIFLFDGLIIFPMAVHVSGPPFNNATGYYHIACFSLTIKPGFNDNTTSIHRNRHPTSHFKSVFKICSLFQV